ncbi:SufS family cysteine desulfurase [Sneathiella sp. P13V-1]|uniref:aminotransferase class V-fold PLP-dependent enzyme n=1 Tax=Sneathiella sp. P13V-1 TaxID=2697366 RepID=UPI00187B29F6|nr:cysteine desulfurase [Sneathiella sp. P13V-1]MBE7637701.1 SufS family cysteine desulfurase [Sneathiella sp. P13V-1]
MSELMTFDVEKIRSDFPIFKEKIHGKRLTFLDSGASAQKPQAVLDAVQSAYSKTYANVHRGVHYLSQKSTELYEGARETVRAHLNAESVDEIIFTKSTTEAINLAAQSFGLMALKPGDEILLSYLEHHSNIVPWQLIAERTGATVKAVPINEAGELLMDEYDKLLTDKTKIVAITHVSNAIGTVTPVKEIISRAHDKGIPVLIDGSQAVPHMKVDVRDLDADFYVFTGHKIFAPTGIGVLYGKNEWLEKMPPYQGGGDMINRVTFDKTTYATGHSKFEAGTPPIVQAIGLGAAIDYVNSIGFDDIGAHEQSLLAYATEEVRKLNNVRILGEASHKAAIVSFTMDGIHPHDIGTIIDQAGVAVRVGHHCAQPLMDFYDVPSTVRASFAMYNNKEDVDALVDAIQMVQRFFA